MLGDSSLLPFAQITDFNPGPPIAAQGLHKDGLYSFLANHVLLNNVFLAIQITGDFSNVKIRRPRVQEKPYPSVLKVAEEQVLDHLADAEGVLIGFWTPQFFKTISVPGFHLHFLNEARDSGGHVIDFALREGHVAFEIKSAINIVLPEVREYLSANLDASGMDEVIRQVEG